MDREMLIFLKNIDKSSNKSDNFLAQKLIFFLIRIDLFFIYLVQLL